MVLSLQVPQDTIIETSSRQSFKFFFPSLQTFARTEADAEVLAYSEGAVVPCSVTADMSLAEVTSELVKVRGRAAKSKKRSQNRSLLSGFSLLSQLCVISLAKLDPDS